MSMIPDFGETYDIAVTVLVDNRADLLVKSTDTVKYFQEAPLLAEHGFAAFIALKAAGITILWDAGITRSALMENVQRMKIDLSAIDKIALSHGHLDHIGAMTGALNAMHLAPAPKDWPVDVRTEEIQAWAAGRRVPLIAHPAAFRERWDVRKDGTRRGPFAPPPRGEWEAAGAQVLLAEGPTQLGPGCWVTGQVPRRSFERMPSPSSQVYRDGDRFLPDEIDDDQAIVINVRDKGLVVVSGCAHAGIVNTVNYAREISGVDRVWGILGGFHLASSSAEQIEQTIAEIGRLQPRLIAPSHCTGFPAIARFASVMPEAFAEGVAGATYLF